MQVVRFALVLPLKIWNWVDICALIAHIEVLPELVCRWEWLAVGKA